MDIILFNYPFINIIKIIIIIRNAFGHKGIDYSIMFDKEESNIEFSKNYPTLKNPEECRKWSDNRSVQR